MTEATWGSTNAAPEINWRMSAALENVPRGGSDLAEVTSLESAVREWLALDPEHQTAATLTPEEPVRLNESEGVSSFAGNAIRSLAGRLPAKKG